MWHSGICGVRRLRLDAVGHKYFSRPRKSTSGTQQATLGIRELKWSSSLIVTKLNVTLDSVLTFLYA